MRLQVIDSREDEDLDLANAAQDASIIRFVNQILTEAIDSRATDVHIEPYEDALRLRYRIDGVLTHANVPGSIRRYHAAIVSRLKILSHLDIAEKRLPQDGRIKLKIAAREIDVRVSIIPMIHGEAVVLRILDRGDAVLGTEHLGLTVPFVLFGIFRYLYLVHRRGQGENPTMLLLGDRPLLINLGLWAGAVVVALYVWK